MSKQRILMIVALCFVLIGTVAAGIPHEPRPDSVVICGGQPNAFFHAPRTLNLGPVTTPESISQDACLKDSPCSPCIRSLENQGCQVVDLTITDVTSVPATRGEGDTWGGFTEPGAIFVLSCAQP